MSGKKSGVILRQGYEPGAIGRIVELHGRYYDRVWGSGAAFEILIAREVSEFIEHYDPDQNLLLTAHQGGAMIGSLALVGRTPEPGRAQLRFFIVDEACRRCGAGKALLDAGLAWCRERGFSGVFLWTVDNLAESRRMYERAGFAVTERVPDARYTALQDTLKMELDFSE